MSILTSVVVTRGTDMTAVWQFCIWVTLIGLTSSIRDVASAIKEKSTMQCPQGETK